MTHDDLSVSEDDIAPWLGGRSFEDWFATFDETGYVVFENVLSPDEVAAIRAALAPHLEKNVSGRNDFEGLKSNRVYALLAKSPVFADLASHPLALAFAEAELGRSCLLSACLAINLQPGETAQPWHSDDEHIRIPRPRDAAGVSAFWAIDAMTEDNGATEILPGSHKWPSADVRGAVDQTSFIKGGAGADDEDPGAHQDAVKALLPSGGLMVAKGALLHRGGANRSNAARLIITPQYCAGWARQLENMALAVPPETAARLPERARELVGYSIHPPLMGYVDGVHPNKRLAALTD